MSATVVPGVFTTDDTNYLINVLELRHGRFTVANTEGLSPSPELLSFDPGPWTRAVELHPGRIRPRRRCTRRLRFRSRGWAGEGWSRSIRSRTWRPSSMVFLYAQRYATEASTAVDGCHGLCARRVRHRIRPGRLAARAEHRVVHRRNFRRRTGY